MKKTLLSFCDYSWNPFNGCSRFSLGCSNCYAFAGYNLHKKGWAKKYPEGFTTVTIHPEMLSEPSKIKGREIIFVNSMGDIFHKDLPIAFLLQIFKAMHESPNHIFLLFTKRAERMVELAPMLYFTDNIWMGVTIEHKDYNYRADLLRQVPAKVKFISAEPLLSSLASLDLMNIDWLITQGESQIGARPVEESWFIELRDKCQQNNIPFYFKKWGGAGKNRKSEELDGVRYKQFPKVVMG